MPEDWSDFQADWRRDHLADAEFCGHAPGHPEFSEIPYDEDGYCCWCGNGKWKLHAPWCEWADFYDALRGTAD